MRTLRDVLQLSKNYLDRNQVNSSRKIVEDLLSHILKLPRMDLYLQFDRYIDEWEWKKICELLERRLKGEPFEHISEYVDFFSCQIRVSPDCLIPRQETEILLSKACETINSDQEKVVFDICTGSGCIGLSIKKRFPHFQVFLSDISEKCIKLARYNAGLNDLKVSFLQGDLLEPFEDKKADIVFCNPPYISSYEYDYLESSVKNYEPKLALVGGEDGLLFYKRLANDLPRFLKTGAQVFLEIGYDQGEVMKEIFSQSCWKTAVCKKDWAGHDRFFFLEFE